ncbi:MAG: hypothetical protein GX651_05735 [Methanomicrobiales archaeon]|nr:hypothetical protein [Methanomicrobiales archaeon]
MQTGEHVHIISAGEWIHTAFPAILRQLPGITRVYVITAMESPGSRQDPWIDARRVATHRATEAVKELAASLSIPFTREMAGSPVYESAGMVLARIRRDNRRARITFDLSGGPKELCMALLSLAPWTGGEVWSAFDGKAPRRVPVPDRDIRGMMMNVNYQTILAVLLRNRPVPVPATSLPFIPRQYLFKQVWPYYIRLRERKPVPGAPLPQYKRGRRPANDMSQQTFSTFMAKLRLAGLIEEGQGKGNHKEKMYRITENGETAFRFFAEPAANSIIKQMLDGP